MMPFLLVNLLIGWLTVSRSSSRFFYEHARACNISIVALRNFVVFFFMLFLCECAHLFWIVVNVPIFLLFGQHWCRKAFSCVVVCLLFSILTSNNLKSGWMLQTKILATAAITTTAAAATYYNATVSTQILWHRMTENWFYFFSFDVLILND